MLRSSVFAYIRRESLDVNRAVVVNLVRPVSRETVVRSRSRNMALRSTGGGNRRAQLQQRVTVHGTLRQDWGLIRSALHPRALTRRVSHAPPVPQNFPAKESRQETCAPSLPAALGEQCYVSSRFCFSFFFLCLFAILWPELLHPVPPHPTPHGHALRARPHKIQRAPPHGRTPVRCLPPHGFRPHWANISIPYPVRFAHLHLTDRLSGCCGQMEM